MREQPDLDDQTRSETFDETHIDDEGDGDILLDEADPVLDVTQADGDADPDDLAPDDAFDLDGVMALDGVEAEADALLGVDEPRRVELDDDVSPQGRSEVELVYDGLMRNVRGAQASAAHWEARSLSDDDIEDLGYGPDDDAPSPVPNP